METPISGEGLFACKLADEKLLADTDKIRQALCQRPGISPTSDSEIVVQGPSEASYFSLFARLPWEHFGSSCRRLRDERPPPNCAPASSDDAAVSGQRWKPPSYSVKRDDGGSSSHLEEAHNAIFRKVRGILNKLTPERFDKLGLELLNVGIQSQVILKGIILLIFEKALDERKYSSLYALLCQRLSLDSPNFEPPDSNITSFRRLLLNKCQDEFENRSRATEVYDKAGALTPEEEEQYSQARRKMLGNIKFIGELGKLQMVHESILHECIKQLLAAKKRRRTVVAVKDMAEDLECLCQIMNTIGKSLDTEKAKMWMDQYFKRMQTFMGYSELPSRIRFLLRAVIELRMNKWVPRDGILDHGPKTIQQVHNEAAREKGNYMPRNSAGGGGLTNSMGMLEPFGPSGGAGGSHYMNGGRSGSPRSGSRSGGGGGMSDMFDSMPPNYMGGMGIGTGPGVIHSDTFSSPRYNTGSLAGRMRNQQLPNQGYTGSGGGGGGGARRQNGSSSSSQRFNGSGGGGPPQSNYYQSGGTRGADQDMRDLGMPPARMRRPPQSGGGSFCNDDNVCLRPTTRNFTMLRPNTPSMLPRSALTPKNQGPAPIPLVSPQDTGTLGLRGAGGNNPIGGPGAGVSIQMMAKTSNITIKQVAAPDSKKANKKVPSRAELKEASEEMLTALLETSDVNVAVDAVKDMKAPNKYLPELISYMITETLEKSATDRDTVSKVLVTLKNAAVITANHFNEAAMSVVQRTPPPPYSALAHYMANAVEAQMSSLAEVARPCDDGAHHPLFIDTLERLLGSAGRDRLTALFAESKVDLLQLLPESDRSESGMIQMLEERSLAFLFPLLRLKEDLCGQLNGPSQQTGTSLYAWLQRNVDAATRATPAFINLLVASIVKFVTNKTTLAEKIDPNVQPDKMLIETEKTMMMKYMTIVAKLLHDAGTPPPMSLQVAAIYALQVHCYHTAYPKGMLLRLFMFMYDSEVVDEEAFLQWKEEVNEEYPGKGKALFQVNQWLMWLEQAEEESDEDEG